MAYAFLLTQAYGQLMVGAAPLLKQYFLPVSLTAALILSVPSSGGTVSPDLLPGLFRDLSYGLPLAQAVKATRGVVTLQGKVRTEALRQRAENIARSTLGLRELRSTLSIAP